MESVINFFIVLLFTFAASTGAAKGRFQNEDMKSLADIQSAVLTITGNLSSGNACITSPSSTSKLAVGHFIYDLTTPTNIPAGTTIAGLPGTCSSGQIQMSQNAAGSATGDTITFGGQMSQLLNDTKIYVSANGINQQLSSAIQKGLLGGSGSKNYLSGAANGNLEQGTTAGFSKFTTTLTTLPSGAIIPSGTIATGAASITTFAATQSNVLAGSWSLNTQASSAWAAGQGWVSDAFTIDSEDKAKPLTIQAYYSALSGSSNIDFSGTNSQTFAVYIYDVTNAAWIQPAGSNGINQGSGAGYVTATFQTTSNSTQYRLAILALNASAGAVSLNWDTLFVGPQTAPLGAIVTDWVPYTPTFTGFGSVTGAAFFSRRVGDSLEVMGGFVAGTPTGVQAQITLGYNGVNGGIVIDSSKNMNGIAGQAVGSAATNNYSWAAIGQGGNNFLTFGIQNPSSSAYNPAIGTSLVGIGGTFQFFAQVAVVGWSSTVQTSSDTDTRVVAFTAPSQAPTGTLSAAYNVAIFGTVTKDSHNAYNPSTGIYTVPVSGWYHVDGNLEVAATYTAGEMTQIAIQVNGTNVVFGGQMAEASTTRLIAHASSDFYVNAGDTIAIASWTSGTSPSYIVNVSGSNFSVNRLSGPSVIAASDTVSGRVFNATLTFSSGTNIVPWANTDFDDHQAFSSGIVTIPVSGKYQFNARVSATCSGTTAGSTLQIFLVKNGTNAAVYTIQYHQTEVEDKVIPISELFSLKSGDQVSVSVSTNASSCTIQGPTDNESNSFSWIRVGN